jgi:hypothetical protein
MKERDRVNIQKAKAFFNGLACPELVPLKVKYDEERIAMRKKGGCSKCKQNALVRKYKTRIREILERD